MTPFRRQTRLAALHPMLLRQVSLCLLLVLAALGAAPPRADAREVTVHGYDGAGHLQSSRLRSGAVFLFAYDASGNAVSSEALAAGDTDGDFLPDSREETDTCPFLHDADSDDDGIPDGVEDHDLDGDLDAGETDPCDPDTDGDGLLDGTETGLTEGTADPDGEGPLTGTDEALFQPDADPGTLTDPRNADSDGDGTYDGEEDADGNGRVDAGESDPVPLPTGSISGTVYQADGTTPFPAPVAVTLYRGSACHNLLPHASTLSDGVDGGFRFDNLDSGPYMVRAATVGETGHPVQWFAASASAFDCHQGAAVSVGETAEAAGVDFSLQEEASISGTLFDGDSGLPVTGALQVVLYADDPCTGSLAATDAVNPATGAYTLGGLPAGTYFIHVDTTGSRYLSEWHATAGDARTCDEAVAVPVGFGTHATGIDIHLDPGATISGTLFRDDGETPLAGEPVVIEAHAGDGCSESPLVRALADEATGSFVISGLPPGGYTLRAIHVFGDYLSEWWSVNGDAFDCRQSESIEVSTGDEATGADFQLDRGGTVYGTVFEADGLTPIQGSVTVEFYRATQDLPAACFGELITYADSTEVTGAFSRSLPAGTYYLRVDPRETDYAIAWWTSTGGTVPCNNAHAVVVPTGDSVSGKNFKLKPGSSISGHVFMDDGATPVTEPILITAYVDDPCNAYPVNHAAYDPQSGAYRVDGLSDDAYTIRVANGNETLADEWWSTAGDAYFCFQAEHLQITGGTPLEDRDVLLDGAAAVSGTVYRNDGSTPLDASVTVALYPETPCENYRRLITAASDPQTGAYRFENIGPGWYHLKVELDSADTLLDEWWSAAGDAFACGEAQPFEIAEGMDAEGMDFSLDVKSTLSGTLYKPDGVTPMDREIYLYLYKNEPCATNWYAYARSNRTDGTFTFQGLAPGTYYLWADPRYDTYVPEYWSVAGECFDCAAADPVVISSGEDVDALTLSLNEGGKIRGRLMNADGSSPIDEYAVVHVYTGDPCDSPYVQYDWTYDTFELDALPVGTYYVNVFTYRYQEEWWSSGTEARSCDTAEPIQLEVLGEVVEDVDIRLDKKASISGHLYQQDGLTPVSSMYVYLFRGENGPCEASYWTRGWAGADGGWLAEGLEPGTYYLQTYYYSADFMPEWWSHSEEGYDCADADAVVLEAGQAATDIDFRLRRKATISGTVRDGDGGVIGDGEVVVSSYRGTSACDAEMVDSEWVDPENGAYTLSRLEPGTYFIRVEETYSDGVIHAAEWWAQNGEGYDCRTAEGIAVSLDENVAGIDFDIRPGNTLSGLFRSHLGDPLVAAYDRVYLYRGLSACSAGLMETIDTGTGVDGYSVDALPPGIYFLKAELQGYVEQWWSASGTALSCEDAQPIVIAGSGASLPGFDFALYDCDSYPDLPVNDDFTRSEPLAGAVGLVTGNNFCSTFEVNEPEHAGSADLPSVWWSWTAPGPGWFLFSTEGSTFDTTLAIYTGASLDGLTPVAANEDFGDAVWSRVAFEAQAGAVYHLAVSGSHSSANGHVRLHYQSLAGDVSGDLDLSLADAIAGLQLLTDAASPGTVHREADVGADATIGLPEILYVLRKTADAPATGSCTTTDLAEANAADWEGWAQEPVEWPSYLEDDTTQTAPGSAGDASVKFVTDGGWDTCLRYPGSYDVRWDLRGTEWLHIAFLAQNPSPNNFQNGPRVRLVDAEGDYFEYRYHNPSGGEEIPLNAATLGWITVEIPILQAPVTPAEGWVLSLSGTPDISRIRQLEIHADTWDNGFILWVDEVGFEPAPECCRPDADPRCR